MEYGSSSANYCTAESAFEGNQEGGPYGAARPLRHRPPRQGSWDPASGHPRPASGQAEAGRGTEPHLTKRQTQRSPRGSKLRDGVEGFSRISLSSTAAVGALAPPTTRFDLRLWPSSRLACAHR